MLLHGLPAHVAISVRLKAHNQKYSGDLPFTRHRPVALVQQLLKPHQSRPILRQTQQVHHVVIHKPSSVHAILVSKLQRGVPDEPQASTDMGLGVVANASPHDKQPLPQRIGSITQSIPPLAVLGKLVYRNHQHSHSILRETVRVVNGWLQPTREDGRVPPTSEGHGSKPRPRTVLQLLMAIRRRNNDGRTTSTTQNGDVTSANLKADNHSFANPTACRLAEAAHAKQLVQVRVVPILDYLERTVLCLV
jgi:hypothetical protein